MLIGPDHPLATLLPDALNTTDYAPKVGIGINDIMYLLLGGVARSGSRKRRDLFHHLTIRPTKFLSDMDTHGAAFVPIHGNP